MRSGTISVIARSIHSFIGCSFKLVSKIVQTVPVHCNIQSGKNRLTFILIFSKSVPQGVLGMDFSQYLLCSVNQGVTEKLGSPFFSKYFSLGDLAHLLDAMLVDCIKTPLSKLAVSLCNIYWKNYILGNGPCTLRFLL